MELLTIKRQAEEKEDRMRTATYRRSKTPHGGDGSEKSIKTIQTSYKRPSTRARLFLGEHGDPAEPLYIVGRRHRGT